MVVSSWLTNQGCRDSLGVQTLGKKRDQFPSIIPDQMATSQDSFFNNRWQLLQKSSLIFGAIPNRFYWYFVFKLTDWLETFLVNQLVSDLAV